MFHTDIDSKKVFIHILMVLCYSIITVILIIKEQKDINYINKVITLSCLFHPLFVKNNFHMIG